MSDSGEEFWTEERCFIRELVNDPAQPAASLAHCRVTPGVLTQRHRLSVQEWYVILHGEGLMQVGDTAPYRVAAGDTVTIPAGVAQQIRNTGHTDLTFHCLCMPRFSDDCYENLEPTH